MKYQFLVILFLCLVFCDARTQSLGFGKAKSKTFAVVIGISDYSDEAIPDLKFANRDAIAFSEYLQSNAGNNVPEENIKLLINEKATTSRIAAAMDWLVESCEEGDRAMIYFSGHGDVETKTAMQHGFLLTHDSPSSTYIAGAYPLFYLQSVISTLSTKNKASVFMFMDACHAGKLAGSDVGGVEATSSILAKQFANETKILSCQPNEFSLEGEQWGNGRGVFSYHLIQGLVGLADQNDDLKINVLELERYLEDKVSMEVSPNSQIPMTVGIKSNIVGYVDDVQLKKLQLENEAELGMMAIVDSKGKEKEILMKLDSSRLSVYELFKKALSVHPLMNVNGYNNDSNVLTADELYRDLITVEELSELHSSMTRALAVALQENAQKAINGFLKIRSQQFSVKGLDNESILEEYTINAVYLKRAAELLGREHYMYNDLVAKSKYFEGKSNYHLSLKDITNRDSLIDLSLLLLEGALSITPNAPHVLVALAWIYGVLQDYDKALQYALMASSLSPTWPIPYSFLSGIYYNDSNYEKSAEYALKALELQPQYENALYDLTTSYFKLGRHEETIKLCEHYLEDYPENLVTYLELSLAYSETGQDKKAIETINRALKIDSTNALVMQTLANIYYDLDDIESAIYSIDKAIELDPNEAFSYLLRIMFLIDDNKFYQAKNECIQLHELFPYDYEVMSYLAIIYLQDNEDSKALELINRVAEYISNYDMNMFCQFCYHYQQSNIKEAYSWFEKALEKYGISFVEDHFFQSMNCFQEAIKNQRFEQLIARYK